MFEYLIYLFIGVSVLIFVYCNAKILRSDWINKKILNSSLCLLLMALPGMLFWYTHFIGIINWESWAISSTVLTLISVGLYIGKVWGAWDAKYYIVLSLFLLNSNFLLFLNYLILTTGAWIILGLAWDLVRWVPRGDQHISHPFKITLQDLKEKAERIKTFTIITWFIQLSTLWLCSIYITRWITRLWEGSFNEPHQYGILLSAVLLFCYILIQGSYRWIQIVREQFFPQTSAQKARAIGTIFYMLLLAGLCLNFWVTLILYDLRDVIKYAIPTILLLLGIYYLLGAGIYARDYSSMSIQDLQLGDTLYAHEVARNLHTIMGQRGVSPIPLKSSIEADIVGSLTDQKIIKLRQYVVLAGQDPDHSFVAQVKNHPFAHIILISFLGATFVGINIIGAVLREWYFYINQAWYIIF